MKILINSIFSFFYNKGEVHPDISYNGYEVLYLKSGSGTIVSGTNVMAYQAGDVFFAAPNYTRTTSCIHPTQYECIRFQVVGEVHDLASGLYRCSDSAVADLFKTIFTEYYRKDYKYYDLSNLKLQEMMILLSRQLTVNTSSDQNIHNLIKQIDTNLEFEMTVQEMAESLNYNYDYFRHKFKSITGQSATNYINNKRIENACKLLKENKYTCTEIANMCGFSSSSQFSKLFKRDIGISPMSYQKHVKGASAEEDTVHYLLQSDS